MAHLSYSFCMSMLHSLWQAGLLALVYFISEKTFGNNTTPLQKRNWLFALLGAQFALFVFTFCTYLLNIETVVTENLVGNAVSDLISSGTAGAYTPWIFAIYLLGISYKMIKALYEWRHFKKQFNNGLQKPSIDLKVFTALKAAHFGIKRKVQLWFSSTVNAPVTFGFFKPVIVLPVALANHISLKQAETLILHELSHIKANDYLLNWVLIISENIFFFNPFINALCKKIRLEREKYCDSTVIAFEYSPLLYAETLLKAQHIRQQIPQYQLAAVAGKAQLLQRIQFFTNQNNFTHNRSRFIFPLLSMLFILVLGGVFFFQANISAAAKPPVVNITAPVLQQDEEAEAEPVSLVDKFVNNFSEEKLKLITDAVEKQRPVIEKKLKELEPVIKTIQDKAAAFAEQFDGNIVTPVVLKEGIPTRQVIVKEEQSGSKNATLKVYNVSLINGQWVVVPEWMLAAREIPTDSLLKRMDTSAPPVSEHSDDQE
ncbi:M56 family metallopeptidase [Ferruginibacter sp.]